MPKKVKSKIRGYLQIIFPFLPKGFTLVELLVVIAIIAVLAGILFPSLISVMAKGKKSAAMAEIKQMQVSLGLYERDNGDFPPSTLVELGIKKENQINSGIESMVACLSSTSRDTSYFVFKEDKLANQDADLSPVPLKKLTGSSFETNVLWELIDPWSNPYIYFHHRDLHNETQAFYLIKNNKTKVMPNLTKNKTGRIRGYGQYQIISPGVDFLPGTKDDIMSD